MGNLLKLILRFRAAIVFVMLESLALMMLSYGSYYQQTRLFGAMQMVQNFCFDVVSEVTDYVSLKRYNEELLSENARLRNLLDHYQHADTTLQAKRSYDQRSGKLMTYIPANVVGGTTNKQHNFFTLNVGEWEGVSPEMGVITDDGVVGIVVNTSAHYATVMSLLNRDFRISGRLRRTGYLGSLQWGGVNYREVMLTDVPQHVPVEVGDTVETSGYSSMFPEGIFIGTVSSYAMQKGNFHELRVQLNLDFKKLRYVNVVKFMRQDELKKLNQATRSHE
ncbi:MAG: rod shape-determining protein MreC [Prevotellaceae bacterium]|jgi:rod shape-determining protein MreC|nr:rod shape-determining protein MreC [Prevotellaceae bacterium]